MAKPSTLNVTGTNRVLAGLSGADRRRVLASTGKVSMAVRDMLYEANRPIREAYFPLSGVLSLVIPMNHVLAPEVGTIGNEGLAGTPLFLGADRSPVRAFCQIPGESLVMSANAFKAQLARRGPFYKRVALHTQAWFAQVAQGTACNNLHPVEQRMCRWLLLTHDRVGTREFPLTQEFLAQMLGVRRPSVTVVAGLLQRAGLIAYRRGVITIIDRPRLEAASCECYEMVKREYVRLLA